MAERWVQTACARKPSLAARCSCLQPSSLSGGAFGGDAQCCPSQGKWVVSLVPFPGGSAPGPPCVSSLGPSLTSSSHHPASVSPPFQSKWHLLNLRLSFCPLPSRVAQQGWQVAMHLYPQHRGPRPVCSWHSADTIRRREPTTRNFSMDRATSPEVTAGSLGLPADGV